MKHVFAPVLGIILVIALTSGLRAGDDPAPTTTPATVGADPATAPGETPQSALKAYNAGMRAGDVDGIMTLLHATNETEQRLARAVARSEVYVGTMLSAARERFGNEGAARIAQAIGDVSDADIDAARVEQQDARAVLRFPRGGATVMVRVDGEWKASVADMIRRGAGDPQAVMDYFTRRGNFAKVLAQDIAAGQVKTVESAVERIERHERGTADEEPAN